LAPRKEEKSGRIMENDEILNEFLVESREHLAGIESDLLCIEEAGANIDEARVNTVFRAAHSIKGGAAFFGLKRIQELGHKIETVLDMVRSREMVPTPETVNILLISFDKLREMINSPAQSNTADISEPLTALTGLLSACLPQEEKSALHRQVPIQAPHRQEPIMVAESDMNHVRKMGHFIYLVEYDLIHDVERRGRTPLDLIHSLNDIGSILDAAVVLDAIGTLEDTPSCAMPFQVLISTMIAPGFAEDLFEVGKDRISVKFDPNLV
jgi:two-component system chemotaxis sensor kinase CheA